MAASMSRFRGQVDLPVSADKAFAWHEREGALDRLLPPWVKVEIRGRGNGVCDGSTVELRQRLGPLAFRWVAEHEAYVKGRQFCDIQRRGPFAYWAHTHRFEAVNGNCSRLEDDVEYRIPGGWLGRRVLGHPIRRCLERMFAYRHRRTVDDLAAHARHGTEMLHVAVTGARGMVGSELVPLLTTGGHRVTRLVRRTPKAGEVSWDPEAASWDAGPLADVDAVVHLAAENIASGRWTVARKQRIVDSRIQGTRVLSEALANMKKPPRVLLVASAVGYYGDRGDEILTEASRAGEGFLADLARAWEAATRAAEEAGIRVVHVRFGVVLDPRAGALARMLTPFRMGLGGRLGPGHQYWSWISLDDAAGILLHALGDETLSGPVNAVAPKSVTNAQFTRTLGDVLRRPTLLPAPAWAVRAALGEMADALLMASLRVTPRRLLEVGYTFRQPSLQGALRHMLGR